MSFPTMFSQVGRKWTIRNSAWINGAWKPLSTSTHEITSIQNGNIAIIKIGMFDLQGKPMPGSEMLAMFPRQELIVRPFRFWIDEHIQVTSEKRDMVPCPLGNFDCWVSNFTDPGQKDCSGTICASMQFPGLIVREQRKFTAEELDEQTGALLNAREMHDLKELVAFSG